MAWFSYSFEGGFERHDTAAEAEACAEQSLNAERECAKADGEWNEDVGAICWGEMKASAESYLTGFNDCVDFVLVPTEPKTP